MQQNLVLILVRDLADKLASAVFLIDAEGTLVFFNDRAAEILGTTFSAVGHMPMDEWVGAFSPSDPAGRPLDPAELPLVLALKSRRPAHRSLRIRAADGTEREIEVTAFPLLARHDEFVGACAVFWEPHPETDTGATPQ